MAYTISGILNNCGLHIAVPSVIDYVRTLGAHNSPENQPFFRNYLMLKNLFCEYYQLPANTSFKKLSLFLSTKSFIAQQLILGPVLRKLADSLYSEQLDPFQYSSLAELPQDEDLDNPELMPGKFRVIELRTLIQYLLNPLGIKLAEVYVMQQDAFIQEAIPLEQEIDEIFNISIYNSNQHYELDRLPQAAPQTSQDAYAFFEAQLSKAAGSTDESMLMELPDLDGAEIPIRDQRVINQSVKELLEQIKNHVQRDFLTPVRTNIAQYLKEYKEHFFQSRQIIESYASKTKQDYQLKGEVLLQALSGNLQALQEAISKNPMEYQAINTLLQSLSQAPNDEALKSELTYVLQEALKENDHQLAEVLQAQEFNYIPRR